MSKPTTVSASTWSALDILLRQGLQFGFMIVLARMLAPEDFGIYALLAFFTTFSVVFLQGGLSVALVQRQDTSHDEESAMFWWNLFASSIAGAAFILASPLIAAYFNQPVLRALSITAAAQLVLAAASETQIALLTREMRFQVLARAGMIATPIAGCLAVAAAWYGAGIWSLAIQGIAFAGVNSLAIWMSMAWRPNRHFRFATIRHAFSLGAWVAAVTALDLAFTSSINLIVGKLAGVRQLGFFDRAATMQANATVSLAAVVGRITLPLLASRKNDLSMLRETARDAIGFAMLVNVPMLTGIAVLSDAIVEIVFGAKWLPAAPILTILALGGIMHPLHIINVHLAIVRNQTKTFVTNELFKKLVGITCIAIGVGGGTTGIAISLLCYNVITLVAYQTPAYRDLAYGPFAQLRDLASVFFAASVMACFVWRLRIWLAAPPLTTLVICGLAGAMIYVVVGLATRSRIFGEATKLGKAYFQRKIEVEYGN